MGRYDEAIATYRKALDLSSLNAPIRMNLALAYYKAGRYAEAIPEFDTVLGTNPELYNAIVLKADCYLQLGQLKPSIALLQPLAADHADDPAFDYILGMALLQDKQTEAGLAYLDRILKRGDTAQAHLLMGVAKQGASDLSEAREEFQKAVALDPSLPMAHALLGRALLSTGDREGARAAFQQELAQNPNDFESNLYLGVILKEEQDYEGARKYVEHALELRPDDPGALYQKASLLLASGATGDALPLLERITAATPSFVEAHVSLATAYYRLKRKADGDRERAIVDKLNAEAQAKQPGAQPAAPK
jgi:tetratricopeptide (TPR) repeat protein